MRAEEQLLADHIMPGLRRGDRAEYCINSSHGRFPDLRCTGETDHAFGLKRRQPETNGRVRGAT